MKKIIAMLLVIVMALSLVACGGSITAASSRFSQPGSTRYPPGAVIGSGDTSTPCCRRPSQGICWPLRKVSGKV